MVVYNRFSLIFFSVYYMHRSITLFSSVPWWGFTALAFALGPSFLGKRYNL